MKTPHSTKPARRPRAALAAVAALLMSVAISPTAAFASAGAGSLREGPVVEPPRAFSELCARAPAVCPHRTLASELSSLRGALSNLYGQSALRPSAVMLTEERWRQLQQVNLAANRSIQPVEDYGRDVWTLTHVGGDCEEYVLAKLHLLDTLGWPRSAMRITVVQDGQGYHAVLVVETNRGSFVLDNMRDEITTVAASPYVFVVAESVERPGQWVRVAR